MTLRPFRLLSVLAVLFAVVGFASRAQAAPIFLEEFSTNDSNWKNGTSAAPVYNATGGNDGGGYISNSFTASGGAVGGGIIFRGQDEFNSSGNGFVRNWIADGVNYFSIALRHTASVPLTFNLRFSDPANTPGASTVNFTLPVSSSWQTVVLPIYDLGVGAPNAFFQTYGGGSYATVFDGIGHVQVSILGATGLGATETFSIGIDSLSISAVPEPSSIALGCMGVVGAGLMFRRRMKQQAA